MQRTRKLANFNRELGKSVLDSKEICKSPWKISTFSKKFATRFPKLLPTELQGTIDFSRAILPYTPRFAPYIRMKYLGSGMGGSKNATIIPRVELFSLRDRHEGDIYRSSMTTPCPKDWE